MAGKEDAASIYARGYYSIGANSVGAVLDRVRKAAEECSNLSGFIVYNSLGGGTGSGLGSLVRERLANEYSKKTKLGLSIYPSPELSESPC